jgi:hypothetical protein
MAVTNQRGDTVASEFGLRKTYLKFTFEKGWLFISNAPFDEGKRFPMSVGAEKVYVTMPYTLPDKTKNEYRIDSLDSETLWLGTVLNEGEVLLYQFKKSTLPLFNPTTNLHRHYDFAIIIKSHERFSSMRLHPNFKTFYPKNVQYLIANNALSYQACAEFYPPKPHNFASYFVNSFNHFKATDVDSVNYELIVDFDVTPKGLKNLKVVNNISYTLSSHIYDILESSYKYWRLPKKSKETQIPIRFSFFLLRCR